MQKNDHTLLIWVLSWAGVLMALLYSPLGSPELYKNNKYFNENQGVDFNKIIILNSPNGGNNTNNNFDELDVPEQNRIKRNYNYSINAVSNHETATFTAQNAVRPYNHKKNSAYSSAGGTANSGSSFSSSMSAGSKKTYNSGNNPVNAGGLTQLGGLLAMNETNSGLSNDSTATQEPQNDSTQPLQKADEPNIPVGEGWIFLLCMAGVYLFYKFRTTEKENY